MSKLTIGEFAKSKYPDKIPIIVHYENKALGNFLVKNDMTVTSFIVMIRQKIKLEYSDTLVAMINDEVVDPAEQLDMLYNKYMNATDKCLHLNVKRENTLKIG